MQFRADFYHRIFTKVQDKATAMLHLDNCLPVGSEAAYEISPFSRMPDGLGFDQAWQALDKKYGTAVALEESWIKVLKGPFKDVVECLRVFKEAVVCFESPRTPDGARIAGNILSAIRISEMARQDFPPGSEEQVSAVRSGQKVGRWNGSHSAGTRGHPGEVRAREGST